MAQVHLRIAALSTTGECIQRTSETGVVTQEYQTEIEKSSRGAAIAAPGAAASFVRTRRAVSDPIKKLGFL